MHVGNLQLQWSRSVVESVKVLNFPISSSGLISLDCSRACLVVFHAHSQDDAQVLDWQTATNAWVEDQWLYLKFDDFGILVLECSRNIFLLFHPPSRAALSLLSLLFSKIHALSLMITHPLKHRFK